jgi:hypothetical protein
MDSFRVVLRQSQPCRGLCFVMMEMHVPLGCREHKQWSRQKSEAGVVKMAWLGLAPSTTPGSGAYGPIGLRITLTESAKPSTDWSVLARLGQIYARLLRPRRRCGQDQGP